MKTFRRLSCLALIALLLSTSASFAEDHHSIPAGLARGFANLTAGWLEIPQCLTYYSVEYPVIGIVPGALQGAGLTVVRVLGGTLDLLTVGYLAPGSTIYDAVEEPLFPWQGPWLPKPRGE